jgi:hypothetical protein
MLSCSDLALHKFITFVSLYFLCCALSMSSFTDPSTILPVEEYDKQYQNVRDVMYGILERLARNGMPVTVPLIVLNEVSTHFQMHKHLLPPDICNAFLHFVPAHSEFDLTASHAMVSSKMQCVLWCLHATRRVGVISAEYAHPLRPREFVGLCHSLTNRVFNYSDAPCILLSLDIRGSSNTPCWACGWQASLLDYFDQETQQRLVHKIPNAQV